jgi:hypothetical protein
MIDCYRDPSVLQFAAIRAIDAYNNLKKGNLVAATRTIFDRRNPTSLKAVWVGFTGWRIALSEKQISQVVENIENSCERWGLWNGWLCFEGRCSIQLSYGRVACIDSKSFIASTSMILLALTRCREGRRSITTQLTVNCATIVSSHSYSDVLDCSILSFRSARSINACFGMNFKAKPIGHRPGLNLGEICDASHSLRQSRPRFLEHLRR